MRNMERNASPVVFPAGEHVIGVEGGVVSFDVPSDVRLSDVAAGFAAMARSSREPSGDDRIEGREDAA